MNKFWMNKFRMNKFSMNRYDGRPPKEVADFEKADLVAAIGKAIASTYRYLKETIICFSIIQPFPFQTALSVQAKQSFH